MPIRSIGRRELEPDAHGLAFGHAGIVLGSFRESRAIAPAVFGALATGAPVITANTAAARELLRDGESALLVPPESPTELAAAITRLAGDGELRASIAAGGRRVFAERAARDVRGRQWREPDRGPAHVIVCGSRYAQSASVNTTAPRSSSYAVATSGHRTYQTIRYGRHSRSSTHASPRRARPRAAWTSSQQ